MKKKKVSRDLMTTCCREYKREMLVLFANDEQGDRVVRGIWGDNTSATSFARHRRKIKFSIFSGRWGIYLQWLQPSLRSHCTRSRYVTFKLPPLPFLQAT